MNKPILLMLLTALMLFGACRSSRDAAEGRLPEAAARLADIPYTEVKGYFLRNNVNSFTSPSITDRREFDGLFGAATTMGEDGRPTVIDFKTHYVIAVSLPPTDHDTEIVPVSLKAAPTGPALYYRVVTGEERSYTVRPCLLLLVSNRYSGEVTLSEIH